MEVMIGHQTKLYLSLQEAEEAWQLPETNTYSWTRQRTCQNAVFREDICCML